MTAGTSIVALLPSPGSAAPCLDCALAAASGLDATITAIHVGFDAGSSGVAPEELSLQRLRDLREGSPEQRGAATRAAYEDWVRLNEPSIPLSWRDEKGIVETLVADDTAAADLVVMRNPRHLDGSDAFHSVLFRSRRLLLVAPAAALPGPPTIGRHVAIGWKPTPQAERAVRDAARWLRKAGKVTVLCVDHPERDSYAQSARAALSAIGLDVDPLVMGREGPSVGARLLSEARRLGADCLLIGAFRRGVVWDAIFGGVTRDVLAGARLPVFMRS